MIAEKVPSGLPAALVCAPHAGWRSCRTGQTFLDDGERIVNRDDTFADEFLAEELRFLHEQKMSTSPSTMSRRRLADQSLSILQFDQVFVLGAALAFGLARQ